ncbi:MAG: hypothetical protein LBS54_05850 [Dysgonamonadaceae bacterium]|nr:hypothetical protein [Dysgonamonadaceae bacterium]
MQPMTENKLFRTAAGNPVAGGAVCFEQASSNIRSRGLANTKPHLRFANASLQIQSRACGLLMRACKYKAALAVCQCEAANTKPHLRFAHARLQTQSRTCGLPMRACKYKAALAVCSCEAANTKPRLRFANARLQTQSRACGPVTHTNNKKIML